MIAMLTGRFTPAQLRLYIAVEAAVFWGLILLCYLLFPSAGNYSIFSHTFSFLGSWDSHHNPQYWWLFTAAMAFWGIAHLPLVLFMFRQLHPAGFWLAASAALLQTLGCFGVILVALFPDVHGDFVSGWRWTDIHEKVAVIAFAGFGLSIPLLGIILLRDFFARERRCCAHWGHGPLFAVWTVIVAAAVYNQTTWAQMYEARKAEAALAGASIGSSWGESLYTYYAFPFWENVLIYSLYLFLAAFPLLLSPRAEPA